MVRTMLMRPTSLDETAEIERLKQVFKSHNKEVYVDRKLLFWEHHFEAFETCYPNGHRKEGSIRYIKDMVRVPFGAKLPVFESEEYKQKTPPRGIATIDYVIYCRLDELTQGEWLRDGFISPDEIIESMQTYYPDINSESMVSYYKFAKYNPHPSKKELESVLKITKPWEPRKE